jgi:hypothetical protein
MDPAFKKITPQQHARNLSRMLQASGFIKDVLGSSLSRGTDYANAEFCTFYRSFQEEDGGNALKNATTVSFPISYIIASFFRGY